MNKIFRLTLVGVGLIVSGCGHFTKMENVYIDNSAVTNYVGNPCGFYVGDRCVYIKSRNPDNPYKKEQK